LIEGILYGVVAGVASGFTPGLHPNDFFSNFAPSFPDPSDTVAFTALSESTNVPLSKLETMFLGIPDDAGSTTVLVPLQAYTAQGRAREGAGLVAIGATASTVSSTLLVPALSPVLSTNYHYIAPLIPFAILSVVSLQARDNGKHGLVTAGAASLIGYIALDSNIPVVNPIGSMLTGFFAIGPGVLSVTKRVEIPTQHDVSPEPDTSDVIKSAILASTTGILLGFLPGLGPANVVSIFLRLGMNSAERYVMATSGVDSADAISSVTSLYYMDNPRSGASVYLQRHLGCVTWEQTLEYMGLYALGLVLGTRILTACCSPFGRLVSGARGRMITASVVVGLTLMTALHGPGSLGVALAAAAVSIYSETRGVDPSLSMACLAVPTALTLLGDAGT